MKTHILASLLFGALLGSLATFLSMRGGGSNSHTMAAVNNLVTTPETVGDKRPADPFASPDRESSPDPSTAESDVSSPENSEDPWLKKLDMSDPIKRDVCISYWYMGMSSVVDTLEIQTGHKFKRVAKLSAGPVEILEEQAAFMKTFLAETKRLYPRSEQAVPSDGHKPTSRDSSTDPTAPADAH